MMVGCFVTGSVCLELILWNSPPQQRCNLCYHFVSVRSVVLQEQHSPRLLQPRQRSLHCFPSGQLLQGQH